MKKRVMALMGVVFTTGLILILHAQEEASTSVQMGSATLEATPVEAAPADSIVGLAAEAQGLGRVSPGDLPENGTFWMVTTDGVTAPWPCPPRNANLPVYGMAGGQFIVDATGGKVAVDGQQPVADALAALADAVGNLIGRIQESQAAVELGRALGIEAEMDSPSGGGFSPMMMGSSSADGMWLQIFCVTNGVVSLSLNNATDAVYEVESAVTLVNGSNSWGIETEVWPVDTNAMPFTLPELDRTSALFFRARDWTGVTSLGNTTPEWWFYSWFGRIDLSDTNLDSTGNETLLYDYTNGLDPNVIDFSIVVTNSRINTSLVPVQLNIADGTPYYMAIVDDTNFNPTEATWHPYVSSNIVVSLDLTEGKHDIWIGLRGFPTNATQTWQETAITVDTTPPAITVTNPIIASGAATTVSVPFIQVQGLVSEELSSLTYDVSNATSIVTNQTGYAGELFYDTNLMMFTTNSFQLYDMALTNGLNTISIHATDLAGNVTTTNFNVTLDYSGDTNAPVLNLVWPTNGTVVAGSNFTAQATIDDNTATVFAVIDGETNTGTVYRNGNVLVENLPLASGTNLLSITATDAAGNSVTTNISVIQSAVTLTIDPISDDQLNQTSVNVTGTVSGTNEDVWVNGVQAMVNTDGTWIATGVPVSSRGTASLNVGTYPAGSNPSTTPPDGGQQSNQFQPAQVVLAAYQYEYHYWENDHLVNGDWYVGNSQSNWIEHVTQDCWMPKDEKITKSWVRGQGGVRTYSSDNHTSFCSDGGSHDSYAGSYSGGYPENSQSSDSGSYDYDAGIEDPYAESSSESARMVLDTGGNGAAGTTALYLVMARVWGDYEQLPASAVRFVNQLAGSTTEDVTNDIGAVWSQALVSVPAGMTNVDVTPIAQGNIYFTGTQAKEMTIQSLTATNGATQIGTTTNWACVKTNDYVIVQATLNMTNTAAIAQAGTLIKWSGGEAVTGNPLQRKVSKATSAETTVTASLGSTNLTVNVWVVWATMSIQTNGSNPSPLSFPTIYDYEAGSVLGIQYGTNSSTAAGKICAVATITPAGIHSIITNSWNFRQNRMSHDFYDGSRSVFFYDTTWTNDDPTVSHKTVIPDGNDKLYSIDGPNIGQFNDLDSTETYNNFYDFVTWNSQVCCDTNNFWCWQARWKVNHTPQVEAVDLDSGTTIILPANSLYPPP